MIKTGDKVKMSDNLKKGLVESGCKDHVDEFGDCIGIVEDYVNYNNDGENDPNKIGPEFNIRWQPSKLRYGYLPEELIKVKNTKQK